MRTNQHNPQWHDSKNQVNYKKTIRDMEAAGEEMRKTKDQEYKKQLIDTNLKRAKILKDVKENNNLGMS